MKTEDNINFVVAHIKRFQRKSLDGMERTTRVWAFKLRDEIRQLAPRDTGAYVSSINVREKELGGVRGGFEIDVYSDSPYGRRLEFGFAGVDSLGRVYHQAPRPHWRPAEDNIMPQYREAVMKEIPRWWK